MIELKSADFHDKVKEGVWLVDFWAPWCGPCRMITPSVEELSSEMEDVNFAKVNVDDAPDIASQYKVMSIPTLIVYKNGEPQDSIIGVVPKKKIRKSIEKHM
ncbi:MAG: thioredoxin [Candidatus Cloacimonetes bacterium]|nr:thioredoxin [Candidatus Cloacimonadota bacterium]